MGRKLPIVFAGKVFNDTDMLNIGTWKQQGDPTFQEDVQFWVVSQSDVGRNLVGVNTSNPVEYTADLVGFPEWGSRHLGPDADISRDNADINASYRDICAVGLNAHALVALIMDFKEEWDNDTFFDYMDRWYGWTHGVGGTQVSTVFTREMWDQYRADYGPVWPDTTYSPPSLNITINGNGSVTKNPDQSEYNPGDNVTIEALPEQGYIFSSWSGDLFSNNNPVTLTMNSTMNITASFVAQTTDSLVGHWPLDETTGTVAADLSESNNHGILLNGAGFDGTPGIINNALRFDGNNDAVQISTVNWNLYRGTISLWAYADNLTGTLYLFGHTIGSWSNRLQLYMDDGHLGLGLGDSHTTATDIFNMVTHQWVHIALVWNGTNYIVYVNGTARANGTYTGLTSFESYADIGNNGNNTDRAQAFNGLIDEVRIYNHVLDNSEILALYEQGSSTTTYTISASAGQDGSISPSGTMSVTAGEDRTFTFTPDTGYHIENVVVDNDPQGAISSYTFNNINANHTISVTFAINTYSITTTADAGGIFFPNGDIVVDHGSNQPFTIILDDGYYITDVQVDGVSQGTISNYTFYNVTADHTISATFASASYTIAASAGNGGSIDPSGEINIAHGANQPFTIAAENGYYIEEVKVDNIPLDTVPQNATGFDYIFTNVTAGHTITATFEAVTFTITPLINTGGTTSPSDAISVNAGNDFTFTFTPDTGYYITEVLIDGVSQGLLSSYTFNNVNSNHTIEARFSNMHTIRTMQDNGVSISPAGIINVSAGSSETFTIEANPGYRISDVLVDGQSQGPVSGYTFDNINENHIIRAISAEASYTISATAEVGGNIDPAGQVPVNAGYNIPFTITPNTGYDIDNVSVDGVSQGAISSYTFNNVNENHTITADFTIRKYTITPHSDGNGTIYPNSAVEVNHGGSRAFTIAPNTGYRVDDVKVDGVSQGSITSYTFNNVTANHTISVTFTLKTVTIIASAGNGGSIDPSGSIEVPYGSPYTFTISPDTGQSIVKVEVNGVSVGNVSTYTFENIIENQTITAFFDNNTYTISAQAEVGGSITPAGSVFVTHGEDKTFNINPENGFKIANVRVDGTAQGAVSSYTFNDVTASHTILALFTPDTYSISASAGAGGSISPEGTIQSESGSNRSFSITPDNGYHIENVVVDGISQGTLTSYTFNNINENHTITVSFAKNTYTLTSIASDGGTISPYPTIVVDHGVNQTFTFAAYNGYHISDVKVNGISHGTITTGTYTFYNITNNQTIEVHFAKNVYTINANAGDGGMISPSGTLEVLYDTDKAFTITPDSDRNILDVKVDGVSQGIITSYTFSNISEDHTITAIFELQSYIIDAHASSGGTITPAGSVPVSHGTDQSFNITPNTGHHITDVIIDGNSQGAISSYTFNDVTIDHTIEAEFTIDTYTITVSSNDGGHISEEGSIQVEYGASPTYTIIPVDGYFISDVLIDGVSQGAINIYSFSNISDNHSLAASFAVNQYTINAQVNPLGAGSIDPSGETLVDYGQSQTYTISPAAGSILLDVQIDGTSAGPVSQYTFSNVKAPHDIVAIFTQNTYSISANAGQGGTISPSGVVSVVPGESQVFNITAEPGKQIVDVLVDGVSVGPVNSHSFNHVNSNHTISVFFTSDSYNITANASPGGKIAPAGVVQVESGSQRIFTITPDTGYQIKQVWVDTTDQGNGSTYTFTNITANHTISVIFESIPVEPQDLTAPEIETTVPKPDAIQVPLNSLLVVDLTDSESGIDPATVVISLDDNVIYQGDLPECLTEWGTCRRTGNNNNYTYTFQALQSFKYDQKISLTVTAADLESNQMTPYTFTFTTEMYSFGFPRIIDTGNIDPDSEIVSVQDTEGNLWIAWAEGDAGQRDIYITRKSADTGLFDTPINITNDADTDQCCPDIAMDAQGTLLLTWQSQDNSEGNWEIYFATSTDGTHWSQTQVDVDNQDANQTNPVIVVDNNSPAQVYIAWEDDRSGNQDIFLASSNNNFLTQTIIPVTNNSADQTDPVMAVDSVNGGVYLAWTDTRNGNLDIYGAASSDLWQNIPLVTKPGDQFEPDLAYSPLENTLHMVWVDNSNGNNDIFYGTGSGGLPAAPIQGINIVDDSSDADQTAPAIVLAGTENDTSVFVAWQDDRNVPFSGDSDIYMVNPTSDTNTNILVTNDPSHNNQTCPVIGTNEENQPYLIWIDEQDGTENISYTETAGREGTLIASNNITATQGGIVGAETITGVDDVRVEVPAGAFWTDVTLTITKVDNPPTSPASALEFISSYEFGPSSEQEFSKPITITIPYEVDESADGTSIYWYDPQTGDFSQYGISNVEHVVITPTLHAIRFQTTHFTQYLISKEPQVNTKKSPPGLNKEKPPKNPKDR
ncbi:MAG: LamG domain-containing protein [Sedimentisphaerales bacterium]|nr:LamG domain-containing protein [Sedimentisphaerales bacterium]